MPEKSLYDGGARVNESTTDETESRRHLRSETQPGCEENKELRSLLLIAGDYGAVAGEVLVGGDQWPHGEG